MAGPSAKENMHQLFLEALRHREQEIVPYLAIIGPALGGFIWLLGLDEKKAYVFVVGTIGVQFLLLVGAVYSLALGYNYRYITLELAKLEAEMGMTTAVLTGWPRSPVEFRNRYTLCGIIPWCTPPEIIKVFWSAFLLAIAGVSVAAYRFSPAVCDLVPPIPIIISGTGVFCLAMAWLFYPYWFGRKLRKKCDDEKIPWNVVLPPRPET